MTEGMSEQLPVLAELQRKDIELTKFLEARRAIPAAVEEKDRGLEEAKNELAEKEKDQGALALKRRTSEKDLEAIDKKIKDKEAQLIRVTNNKEYQALLSEIESSKEALSRKEGELLRLMEQEESLARELERGRDDFKPVLEEVESAKKELRAELQRNEELIPVLERERESIAARLSPDLRALYERIFNGKSGLAVVPVRKGACGGCFTAFPPQFINEVRRKDRLQICENCGRIVVWNEEAAATPGTS